MENGALDALPVHSKKSVLVCFDIYHSFLNGVRSQLSFLHSFDLYWGRILPTWWKLYNALRPYVSALLITNWVTCRAWLEVYMHKRVWFLPKLLLILIAPVISRIIWLIHVSLSAVTLLRIIFDAQPCLVQIFPIEVISFFDIKPWLNFLLLIRILLELLELLYSLI